MASNFDVFDASDLKKVYTKPMGGVIYVAPKEVTEAMGRDQELLAKKVKQAESLPKPVEVKSEEPGSAKKK